MANRNFLGPSGTILGLGEFWLLTIAGFALFFGAWTLVAWSGLLPANLLPTPRVVWETLVRLWTQPFAGHVYADHLTASIGRFLMGWAIAVAIGVPLGLLMGWYRILDEIITPLFDSIRFVAPLAWVPLAALWFGTGIGGPLLIIFVGSFAPCLISSYRGARLVEPRLVEAAQTMGASGRQIIQHVLVPGAMPSIISGLRVSAGLGWQSLVGSELIVVGAGLGYLMVQGQGNLATNIVIAGMIGIGVVGFAIDVALRGVETWFKRRWGQA
ncbi:ABC transporter permease [Sediminicoccus sp. KRV36]|uniref:ABC transporter permease n=1 Tax=Sediminicoccus sp. KRV36 TaxID=3133721 RepID=UPI00200C30CE|nr:ABC transporter permease [Sediminicoccus rosea]UPY35606.1 ABC transporter permease [Sediminicoccus rosea]